MAIEAERSGVEFPVPFETAWQMAGYKQKGHAKRKLTSTKSRLIENRDYLSTSGKSSHSGRSSDEIWLTCDAFKQFCLLAETDDGDRVLGIKEIREIEYRRTIIDQFGNVLNAGKTLNKGRLCQEFGFISRSGKPDYKLINALIQEAIAHGAIASPWREVTTLASLEFDALLLPKLKQYYEASPSKRQMWVAE
jgi:hypothetical protein